MIITFDLSKVPTIDNAKEFIIDNCTDVRVRDFKECPVEDWQNTEKALQEHLSILRANPDVVYKSFCQQNDEHQTTSDNPKMGSIYPINEYLQRLHYVNFQSNKKHYHILFICKCYIANDNNKTFKIINNFSVENG